MPPDSPLGWNDGWVTRRAGLRPTENMDTRRNGAPDLTSALIELKAKYVAQLASRIAEMDALCPALSSVSFPPESLLKLTRLAHILSGSGKTFDLPAISETGRALEIALGQAEKEMSAGSLPSATLAKIKTAAQALKKACQSALHAAEPGSLPEVIAPAAGAKAEKPQEVLVAAGSELVAGTGTGQLMEQLRYLGYTPRPVGNIADLVKNEGVAASLAVIIATAFSPEDTAAIRAYLQKREALEAAPPILYLAPDNTFDMRLAAVRLRGDAFLTFPVDHLQLIDRLGTLAERSHLSHYHVLIVDDEEMLATRYGIALERAGMNVTVLTDPKRVLEVMDTAAIDLVLMDFDMPGCNGYELASMLRQMDNYVCLPILFLSTQTNLDSLLKHAHLGIDDFLTKPVAIEQLVKAVSGRAARSSVLHKFIDQDSATGLLNHTRLKKELTLEVSRAMREKSRFAYALLDIDHFKEVNDTFGHTMGDVVIKTLAHLLRQRLRITDMIGRYGGDEFGVVLPGADEKQALRIVEEIHTQFSLLVFTANQQEFHVTFSAGIAAFPAFATDVELSLAADQSLYKAKHLGRNQLIIASPD